MKKRNAGKEEAPVQPQSRLGAYMKNVQKKHDILPCGCSKAVCKCADCLRGTTSEKEDNCCAEHEE